MFSKPTDVVIMLCLFLSVFLLIGWGVSSIEVQQGQSLNDTAIITVVQQQSSSTTGLGATTSGSSDLLDPPATEISEPTEEGFLSRGLQALRSISASFKSFEKVLFEAQKVFSIPVEYVGFILATMIISLMLMIYTWWRGRQ